MRSIRIDFGPDAVDAASAISDVMLAAALLVGAATKAEEALASTGIADRAGTHWSHEALKAAGPLGRIIRSCNELERAVAGDV
jgi:hypothetical protein